MIESFIPVKGDTVRHAAWHKGDTARVTAVGERRLLASKMGLPEESWDLDTRWIKVETPPPLPEGWANAYPSGVANTHRTRGEAEAAATPGRVALVRIWTDADGEDRIERMTS